MLVYGRCDCFVMQILYVFVLCASCGSSQCSDDKQFVAVVFHITSSNRPKCSGTPLLSEKRPILSSEV